MRGIGLLALAIAAGAIACKEQSAGQPADTEKAKLPIVVYYTLPG